MLHVRASEIKPFNVNVVFGNSGVLRIAHDEVGPSGRSADKDVGILDVRRER
jgi:hypothetical protein